MSLFLFFQDGIDIVEDTADLLESLDLPPDSDDIDGVVDVLQGDIKGDLRTDIKDYVQDIKAVLKQVIRCSFMSRNTISIQLFMSDFVTG